MTEELKIDAAPQTFAARQERAMNDRLVTDPKGLVTVNGEDFHLEDVPSIRLRAAFGYGHFPGDVKHREHLIRPDELPWPYTPSTCLVPEGKVGVWVDEEHLACPGCGLDFT